MTSPQQGRDIDGEGWLPWSGGECPVAAETVVEVMFRDDWIGPVMDTPCQARDLRWDHRKIDGDIMHYRVIQPAPPSPAAVEHVERGEEGFEYVKRLEAYALEITKALTGLVGGGSEMFGRKLGKMYTADIDYCVRQIRDRNTRANERYIAAVRAQKEAERALDLARTVARTGER